MRAFGVVLDAPVFDQGFGLAQRREPMLIQAFIAEFSVEALVVCILHGFAWSDERQLHADLIGPSVQGPAGKLWAVVHGDRFGQPMQFRKPLQHLRHPQSRQ